MPVKAVILAAGTGARLCPLTPFIPKEMLPIGGFPAIHHVLVEVLSAGVNEVMIVLSDGKQQRKRQERCAQHVCSQQFRSDARS